MPDTIRFLLVIATIGGVIYGGAWLLANFPPEQTDNARSAWRTLGDGVERRYWKQDGGKWVQGP